MSELAMMCLTNTQINGAVIVIDGGFTAVA